MGLTMKLSPVLLLLSLCISALASCVTPTDVDPVGNWDTLLTWGPDACRPTVTGTTPEHITVEARKPGFEMAATSGALAGDIQCLIDRCVLTFRHEVEAGVSSVVYEGTLVLDEQGAIHGSGVAVYAADPRHVCKQSFLASGNLGLGVVVSP